MGTFERIRQISPYFFGIFAVLLIAYFVFTSGGEDIMRQTGDPQTMAIGVVNGEKILYKDFDAMVRQQAEQKRGNEGEEQEVDHVQIYRDVWNQMVEEILLRQEAEKAGIKVTDDMIADVLIENPPEYLRRAFTDTAGNFNRAVYLDLITNPENYVKYMGKDPTQIPEEEKEKAINSLRQDLITISTYIRKQKLQENLMTIISAASSVISPEFAREKYMDENSSADVRFIALRPGEINDADVKISDDEIRKYYEDHKKLYKQKAKRQIKYISFPIVPSKDDSAKATKRVDKLIDDIKNSVSFEQRDSIFDLRMAEYGGKQTPFTLVKDIDKGKVDILAGMQINEVSGPFQLQDGQYFFRLDGRRSGEQEVVKASHILLKFTDKTKDSVKIEADKLLKRAKAGESFDELARTHSDDQGSAYSGGDVGYFGKGQMVKEFEEAAFAASPGSIIGPVETQYGWHIIKVVDKKSDEISFTEVVISTKFTNSTKTALFREAISFQKQVEEGASFDELAAKIGKDPIKTAFFEKSRPMLGSQYLTDIAFEGEVGTVIPAMELKNYGVVVVQIADQRQAGFAPVEDVKQEITKKLLNKKKLDALKSKADAMWAKVKNYGSMDNIAAADSTIKILKLEDVKNDGKVSGFPTDMAFTQMVYKSSIGKLLEPFRGENAYYILQIDRRETPDEQRAIKEIPEFYKQLRASASGGVFYQWFGEVRENSEIEDFRSKYYQEY